VLHYGDDPEVEPGQTAVRVFFNWAGRPEGKEASPQTAHAFVVANSAALDQLGDELPDVIVWVEFRPESPAGVASPHGLSYRITDRGRRAAAPDEVPEDFTPVMTRLGPADLASVDTLITAGIANSRAQAIRWALRRIREHPAYAQVLRRNTMSDMSTGNGKVVVNRSMSLDGFIAGPGHAMDWVFDFMAPDEFPEIAAATGAMLIGRRTYEVGKRMEADKPGSTDYPFSGPVFVLTHEPPEPPDPEVTFLTGDIGEAVATARSAAGGKNLEIPGADVASQCLRRGLVDEILVYVLPVLLGDGIRFSSPGLARIDLEPVSSTRSPAVTILRFRVRK
jgi:dihydrofolate reductase